MVTQPGDTATSATSPTWSLLLRHQAAPTTADLYPFFNTVNQTSLASTPAEVAVGNYLRDVWSSFAKNPQHGLDAFWPQYNGTEKTFARTGFNNETISLAPGNMYDHVCRWSYLLQ
ncbi:hypothetical protein PENPOL_c007G07565 [Penicillium polonicum]|uniref:Carboxylesterase type B domain-containing protein n=1 Tax=Penicillium polonicum TaxID=60169 RepID=A0A1V6NI23_PENPO|nr:hypothetical protein PENPOL_c007G07565 [Penicillium polonicum]